MEILIRIAQLFVSLSFLVMVHELGHFTFAKIFKTRVDKFYIFFNPWFSLFKFKPKNSHTEYGIGWLPLGGYVKISGMIDESMDREQLLQEPKPYEFRSKKPWQRLIMILAGVFFNIILAFGIYSGILYTWGEQYLPMENLKYGVVCDSMALKMGMQNGDKIISVDGEKIKKSTGMPVHIMLNMSKTIQVERNGEIIDIAITDDVIPHLIAGGMLISPRLPFVAGGFVDGSPAKEAGMQLGDKIIGIDTIKTNYFDQFRTAIAAYRDTTVAVTVLRDTQTVVLNVNIGNEGKIGVAASNNGIFELRTIEYGILESIPAGIKKTVNFACDYIRQFKLLFKPETKAYEAVGGFIAIGQIFPGTWDWYSFWTLTGFLSIMLAVLNVLPIPALDGGHAVFIIYEMITKKRPSDRVLEIAQSLGLFILFVLLVYANGNDIIKLFQ